MSHRDDYETVHEHDRRENSSSVSYTEEVDEITPRIGLELNDRIHQRQQTQHNDNYNANETLTSTHTTTNTDGNPTLLPAAQITASSSNNSCLPALCRDVNSDDDDDDDDDDENQIEQDVFDDDDEEYTDDPDTESVFSAIKGPAACIFLTFTVTLSLFPSWISELKSSHECENRFRLDNDLYVPFSFVFYNIGDLMGRLISGYVPVDRIHNLSRKLVLGAIFRVGFLPLFLMCNTTTGKDSNMVIRSDLFSLLVQMLFAVSNGLLVSTAFMYSPRLVGSTSTIQARASEIMTFSVFTGLLSGSFLAFPFVQFATQVLE